MEPMEPMEMGVADGLQAGRAEATEREHRMSSKLLTQAQAG